MVYFYKIFIKTEKLHKQEQSCHVERPQWNFVLWCLWFSLQVYFFYLRGGEHWEGCHDSVRIFLFNFTDKEGPHPWPSPSPQTVGHLEAL